MEGQIVVVRLRFAIGRHIRDGRYDIGNIVEPHATLSRDNRMGAPRGIRDGFLIFGKLAGFEHMIVHGVKHFQLFGRDQFMSVRAEHDLAGIAEELARGVIEQDNLVVAVHDEDRQGHDIDKRLEVGNFADFIVYFHMSCTKGAVHLHQDLQSPSG